MLSIKVNGTKIEAETLKEINKLVKKEQERQEKQEKQAAEREETLEGAYKEAWASYGKLAYRANGSFSNFTFVGAGPATKKEEGQWHVTIEGEKSNGLLTLPIGDVPSVFIQEANGNTLALRTEDYPIIWFATGINGGLVVILDIDSDLSAKLEASYQEFLSI